MRILILTSVLALCGFIPAVALQSVQGMRTFSVALKGPEICPCKTCYDDGRTLCTGCPSPFFNASRKLGCRQAENFQASMFDNTVEGTQASGFVGPGVVRMMWFTGTLGWLGFGNTTIRIFVDDEVSPFNNGTQDAAIQFKLNDAHSMKFGWDSHTWGNRNIGKGSLDGGLYFGIQIPFSSKLKITAELDQADVQAGLGWSLYFNIHGLLGQPQVTIPNSGLVLPDGAKLRLQRTELVATPRRSLVIANRSSAGASEGKGGYIYMTNMMAESGTPHFLEGEFKAVLDGVPMRLSSGTEDYFLSAQYFDAGPFQLPNSGANHVALNCLEDGYVPGTCKVAAYRIHEIDPILYTSNMTMTWNCGDHFFKVDPTPVVFYVWVYEW